MEWQPEKIGETGVYNIHNAQDYRDCVYFGTGGPLFERGWALQERLLAARMLHFQERQIFWKCSTTNLSCENIPAVWARLDATDHTAFDIGQVAASGTTTREEKVVQENWSNVVDGYSAMELSQPTNDKFHAVGCIAKRIAQELRSDYVAGLLHRNRITQLCWRCHPDKPRPST